MFNIDVVQDSGLTDVVLHALLVIDVLATREVLGLIPNVFSAVFLKARDLASFAPENFTGKKRWSSLFVEMEGFCRTYFVETTWEHHSNMDCVRLISQYYKR
ncbi:hypothetical protein DAPPUDRAFT_256946 [Daphnia pulex]|uniref:Chromo domain-containing protein n=1 Tax=Daphnia pulex TaxID=6669 RepID=E9HCJ6_DAPPU|nr:hypothetical protein DAPPUDRAFT_256946 [Daphnia pulex]|eukprot:EFX70483.1 hypothetical protein DAPPUDRAFT_256946 [Daphnia pulex]